MTSLRKLVAAAALAGLATVASASSYSGLFVFGDSLSDSGNDALLIGSDPNQVITGNSYIPSQPYASGQFTNGDVWAKTFASAIGLASFGLPSLTGGGDFAFGGARTAANGPGLPPSLRTQTTLFLLGNGGAAPSDALYVVEGGGNDARDTLDAAAASAHPSVLIALAAAAYAHETGAIVDRLQAAGAVHIVVWDVPDLGLAPAVTAEGSATSLLGSQVAQAMNRDLFARLATESDVSLFDVYGLQTSFAADPAAVGLINVTDACGAVPGCDPSTYLFWDGIHPTSAGHALLAENMLVATVPEPATYALLLGGLLMVGGRARRRA